MRNLRVISVAFLLVWGMSDVALGVSPTRTPHHYLYDSWQIEEGLPQNLAKRILQTQDGYLWIATQEGLVQYDGLRFVVFDQKTTPAIRDPEINDFVESPKGHLWIATRDGLLLRQHGEFKRFGQSDGLPSSEVRSLAQGAGNEVWVGTRKGLAVIRGGIIEALGVGEGEMDIQSLAVGEKGEVWIGTKRGLLKFSNGTFEDIWVGEDKVGRGVNTILVGEDVLWVGTEGKGLLQRSKNEWKGYSSSSPLGSDRVQHMYRDRQGAIWISTFQEGLVRYYESEFTSITVDDGLNTNRVECAYEDLEGSLWVGTGSGGLNRLRDGRFTTLTRKDGLVDEMVWGVFQSRKRGMWIGTELGVTHLASGVTQTYTVNEGLADNVVNAFAEDAAGKVWVGTYNGVSILSGRGVERSIGKEEGLPGHDVRSLMPAQKGMWLGIMGGGLVRYDGKVVETYNKESGLISDEVRVVSPGLDGGVWIGTNQGLSYLKDGVLKNFGQEEGFMDSRVFSVFAEGPTDLWVGSDKGLLHFDSKKFVRISSRDGLFDDKVYTVLDDGLGYLWMSSNKGVFRVSKSEAKRFIAGEVRKIKSSSFGIVDGMRSVECNVVGSNSGWRSQSGTLWFATIAGVAMINPKGDSQSLPPKVVLEKLVVDGRQVQFRPGWVSSPGVDSLRIHYAAPTFIVPGEIRFKYRLRGLSDEWVFADTLRVAQYAHLAPGRYVFEVKSLGIDGTESLSVASFEFYLKPYFYQTKAFYVLWAFLVALVALGFHRWRLRRHEKHKAYLEELVFQRTDELEKANQKLKDLSTRDPLTGLRNRRYLLEYIDGELAYANRQHFSEMAGGVEDRNKDIVFVMVDIDHFKSVNDSYGHSAGDQVLVQTADILNSVCREYDKVVRWGGEEFLMVAPKTSRESSHVLAQRIHEAFRQFKFDIGQGGSTVELTCSVGFACYPFVSASKEDMSWEDVVAVADEALYAAKNSGRDRWVGLLGSFDEGSSNLMSRLREGVPSMVVRGEVSVVCSEGDPADLRWEI